MRRSSFALQVAASSHAVAGLALLGAAACSLCAFVDLHVIDESAVVETATWTILAVLLSGLSGFLSSLAANGFVVPTDLGLIALMSSVVYVTLPLVPFVANEASFVEFGWRVGGGAGIADGDIVRVCQANCVYLVSLAAGYSALRLTKTCPRIGTTHVTPRVERSVVVWFAVASFAMVGLTAAISPSLFRGDYAELELMHAATVRAPLELQQLWARVGTVQGFLALLLMIVGASRAGIGRLVAVVLVVVEAGRKLLFAGSRTLLIGYILTLGFFWGRGSASPRSRGATFRLLAAVAVAGVVFGLLGRYRELDSRDRSWSSTLASSSSDSSQSSESTTVLLNELDVASRADAIAARMPFAARYLSDVVTILPPRQVLPFEKVDAASFYVQELDVAHTGQGLGWGVVAQSLVNGGNTELVVRALIFMWCVGLVERLFSRAGDSVLAQAIFWQLCLSCFTSYRVVTLFPFVSTAVAAAPVLLLAFVDRGESGGEGGGRRALSSYSRRDAQARRHGVAGDVDA